MVVPVFTKHVSLPHWSWTEECVSGLTDSSLPVQLAYGVTEDKRERTNDTPSEHFPDRGVEVEGEWQVGGG